MTTSDLKPNEYKILNTYMLPMWRWILAYNINDSRLFTINRYDNETIKT